MAKKTKAAKAAAAVPQNQEKKPKMVDTSEIDDIFNTKKIASATKEEPVSKKRKADKKDTSDKPKKVAKKNESDENEESEESEEEEEEFVEQDFKKVQEVVFAELAAVKNANKGNKKQHVIPPLDDNFGDSRGIKKTNRTTEEGYPLYDVKDLNIGLGKDTPECPFDCQCCF